MKYGELDWNTMEEIVDKLGGVEGIKRFLSGEYVVKSSEKLFTIWRTITLGTQKSSLHYREALKFNGYCIDELANEILKKIKIDKEGIQIDLAMMTVSDLGLKNGLFQGIVARANEIGLEPCPAEAGPALCLNCTIKSYIKPFQLAMKPVDVSDGTSRVFQIIRSYDANWLYSTPADSGKIWDGDTHWVFLAPRK